MMAEALTIREAVEQVQELYSKGTKSKDSRLSSRYIYSVLCNNRSTAIKQKINSNQQISEWCYQSIMIPLKRVKLPHSDKIDLVSTRRLPSPIIGIGSSSIDKVTNVEGSVAYSITTYENSKYNKGRKYTSNNPFVYVREGNLHVQNKINLDGVYIRGLFDNPIEAYSFQDCDPCKDVQDYVFPLDRDTLNSVIKMSSETLIILFPQMKEDLSADAVDDNDMTSQMVHRPQNQRE